VQTELGKRRVGGDCHAECGEAEEKDSKRRGDGFEVIVTYTNLTEPYELK